MVINILILSLSLFFLSTFPIGLALWLDLFIYSSLILYQKHFSEVSVINIILLASYGLLCLLFFGLKIEQVAPYSGMIVYLAFSGLYFYRALGAQHPWTGKVAKHKIEKYKYIMISSTLGVVAIICIVLSWYLKPHPSYIYVPFILMATVSLSKPICEEFLKYPVYFRGYIISKVRNNRDIYNFNKALVESYREIYLDIRQKSVHKTLTHFDEFINQIKQEGTKDNDSELFIIKTENDRGGQQVIGCFKIYFSNPLPIESEMQLCFDVDRTKYGTLAEVGRFAIRSIYRQDGALLECIFHTVAQSCMPRKISFIYCQALSNSARLYRKMGFQRITNDSEIRYDKEFGLPCESLKLNIARKISHAVKMEIDNGTSKKLLNEYIHYLQHVSNHIENVFEQSLSGNKS